uniref:EGF-like domain-containing protein n=1 Tax=Trichuris muris TaxID=70415 RepID=A0A5S6QFV9_TRIMR
MTPPYPTFAADKNDCLSKPCANGWCVDLPSGYKCICAPDVHGVNCNTSESKCAHLHCATGTCKIRGGMPYCHCDDEHYGKHCEFERDPCVSLPCRGLSTCINDFKKKQFECICPPKFEGVYCSEKKVFCHSNTCLNNGTCLESDSPLGYKCSCKTGAFGQRCENDINATSGSKRLLLHNCLIVLTIWVVPMTISISGWKKVVLRKISQIRCVAYNTRRTFSSYRILTL